MKEGEAEFWHVDKEVLENGVVGNLGLALPGICAHRCGHIGHEIAHREAHATRSRWRSGAWPNQGHAARAGLECPPTRLRTTQVRPFGEIVADHQSGDAIGDPKIINFCRDRRLRTLAHSIYAVVSQFI